VADGLRLFNTLSLVIPTICAMLCLIPYRLTAEKSKEVEVTLASRRKG
jgi:hypothetical protein